MNEQYKDLVRYAHILKDENFDNEKDGIYIRITLFQYGYESSNGEKYLTICKNGECIHIEKVN